MRLFIDSLPKIIQNFIWGLWAVFKNNYTVHHYDDVWKQIIKNTESSPINVFPGAFVDWDNTARYGKSATIVTGATPERFKYWLQKLVDEVLRRPDDKQYIFLNAWNEWAESAYIEPDERYGYAYLEAINDVMSR